MATNGMDVVEQLRGRMKFYHVGDPVRRDMERACEAINRLGSLAREGGGAGFTATSVGGWLEDRGVTLLPWQRKKLGLGPKA